jgi:hypothetical protein
MIDRLTETGYYGTEINVAKTKLMRIQTQPSQAEIMADRKQLENVEYSKHLRSLNTNDARFTRENKSRIALAKAAFNKKKTLFRQQTEIKFRRKT